MATQRITAQIQGGDTGVNVGDNIAIDFSFNTDDGSKISSLDFASFFNSTELQFNSLTLNSAAGGSPLTEENVADTANGDGDTTTDRQIRYGVLDINSTFPTTLPANLYTANFTVLAGFDGNTSINVAGTSDGTFEGVPLNLTLDVDEAPIVQNAIADVAAREDDPDTTIDLSAVFTDPDGDPITLTATSGDPSKIAVSIVGTNLILDYQNDQFGNDIPITVTATANDKSVSDEFLVDITELKAPELTKVDGKNLFKVGGDEGNVKVTVKSASSSTFTVADAKAFVVNDNNEAVTDEGGNPLEVDLLSSIFRSPDGFSAAGQSRILAVPSELFTDADGNGVSDFNLGVSVTVAGGEDEEEQTFSSLDSSAVTINEGDVAGDGIFDIVFATEDTNFILTVGGTEEESTADSSLEDDGSAVIDLTGETGDITFNFDVFREAAFDNIIGVYSIDALTGQNITPGSEGYAEAALNNIVGEGTGVGVVNSGNGNLEGEDVIDSITLTGGAKYGLFIITDVNLEEANTEEILEDARNGDLDNIYFPFLGANSDEAAHFKLLGDNVIGVEDLEGGGDKDFNDVIVSFSRATAV